MLAAAGILVSRSMTWVHVDLTAVNEALPGDDFETTFDYDQVADEITSEENFGPDVPDVAEAWFTFGLWTALGALVLAVLLGCLGLAGKLVGVAVCAVTAAFAIVGTVTLVTHVEDQLVLEALRVSVTAREGLVVVCVALALGAVACLVATAPRPRAPSAGQTTP